MTVLDDFLVEDDGHGNSLIVTGTWSDAAARALERGEADRLVLNYTRGFKERNLDFLNERLGIRRLDVLDRSIGRLDTIAELGASLEELSIQAADGATLDLTTLPHLRILASDWSLIASTLSELHGLRSLVTWRFDEIDLHAFRDHVRLERLTIKEAPYLESLAGIGDLPNLATLEIVDARSLTDVSELPGVAESLRELKLETCRAIESIDDFASLANLRFLEVSDCGDIDSFAPLAKLDRLEELYAWGSTRIIDADLSPIQRLPHLREIRMQDRRAYRPRLADVVASLSQRD